MPKGGDAMFKRALIGLCAVGFLAMVVKELPAMRRELKIVRM